MKNKKEYFILGIVFIYCITVVAIVSAVSSDSCNLNVTLINQDPYPAVPGNYVKVVFQVDGVQLSQCEGAKFQLAPSYPFSLIGENTLNVLDDKTYISGYKTSWMIPYTLVVDKSALDGESLLEVHYGPKNWKDDSYLISYFDITIQDSRTDFDAVIQEYSSSEVSIAIANIGKYTANSVIVRIPEQDSFQASGTDGQMVGNLESGDYTLVGFTVSQKGTPSQNSKLKFDIYYTDNIGERRTVNMELPLSTKSGNYSSSGFANRSSNSSSSTSLYWIIIIAVIAIIGYFLYQKYKKKVNGIEKTVSSKIIPSWVKNAGDRDKKK